MNRRPEVGFRPLRNEDKREALSLWQAAFGRALDEAIWQWKFYGAFGHRVIVAELDSRNLIAMFGGIPYPASLRGRRVEIVHLWDNMSHPRHRGLLGGRRGVYVLTVDEFIRHYCGPDKAVLLYGFPGQRHFRLGRHTLDYGRLGDVAYLELDLRALPGRCPPGQVERMVSANRRLDRMAAHFDRIYPFWVRRDSRFVQWRFFEHPKKRYQVYGFRKPWLRSLKGYAVTVAEDASSGILVDWVLPENEREARAFLLRLLWESRQMGWQRLKTWVPAGRYVHFCLGEVGFEPMPEPLGIVPTGRSFDPGLSWNWAAENLYYTMGDGDLF